MKFYAGMPSDLYVNELKKQYSGDGVSIYNSGNTWLLNCNEVYPLINAQATWNLFAEEKFLLGLQILKNHECHVDVKRAIISAVKADAFESIQWFHRHYGDEYFDYDIAELVLRYCEDPLPIVMWMHYNIHKNVLKYLLNFSALVYADDVFEFLYEFDEYRIYSDKQLLKSAIRSGYLEMCKCVIETTIQGPYCLDDDGDCFVEACCLGNLDIVKYLFELNPFSCDLRELSKLYFLKSSSINCLNWLRENLKNKLKYNE